jgi:hypothetical protein
MVYVARWEDEQALKQTFPVALAWGQDGSHGGRNVMTLRKDATCQDQEGEGKSGVGMTRNRRPQEGPVRRSSPTSATKAQNG